MRIGVIVLFLPIDMVGRKDTRKLNELRPGQRRRSSVFVGALRAENTLPVKHLRSLCLLQDPNLAGS